LCCVARISSRNEAVYSNNQRLLRHNISVTQFFTWHRFSNRECSNTYGECLGDDFCDLCSAQDPPRRRRRNRSGRTRSRKWSTLLMTRLTTTSHQTPPSSSCSMHPVSPLTVVEVTRVWKILFMAPRWRALIVEHFNANMQHFSSPPVSLYHALASHDTIVT